MCRQMHCVCIRPTWCVSCTRYGWGRHLFLGSVQQRQVGNKRAAAGRKGQGCLVALTQRKGGRGGAHSGARKKKKTEYEAMKRLLPPLPFSPPSPHNLSIIEAGGFTVSPAQFNTLTHCSDCAAIESTESGITVGSVRGCGLMLFDRQYSLFMVLVSISRGTKQRPMRQPDESVLFICASVRVHRTVRHVTICKNIQKPSWPFRPITKACVFFLCVTMSTFIVSV